MDFKVIGGNTKLVEALADKIGHENIRTEQRSCSHPPKEWPGIGGSQIELSGERRLLCLRHSGPLFNGYRLGAKTPEEKARGRETTAVLCSQQILADPPEGGTSPTGKVSWKARW
jgi:hypothetical protein